MSDTASIIFHHPFPVGPNGASGSKVRPYQMLKAFESLGFEVESVTGHLNNRVAAVERLTAEIRRGRRFDFAYSESHTLPTPLTEPHHLPVRPNLDHSFLSRIKSAGVPVGLFYRDVNWRFDQFRVLYPGWKRHIATLFYRHDWRSYVRSVDHLFLPSLKMAPALPTPWPLDKLSALPPGVARWPAKRREPSQSARALHVIYVGGVTPPLYDLTPLFAALNAAPETRLTLCCRPDEWRRAGPQYRVPVNVSIVHASGKELQRIYEHADLAAILWKPHPYLSFAAPVKLFEAIEYGLPIVTSPGTETACFVQREGIGWTCTSPEEFGRLMRSLAERPQKLAVAYQRAVDAARRNSWQLRAQQVSDTLREVRS